MVAIDCSWLYIYIYVDPVRADHGVSVVGLHQALQKRVAELKREKARAAQKVKHLSRRGTKHPSGGWVMRVLYPKHVI